MHINNFTAGANKFHVLKYTQNFLSDKKLVSTTTHEIHLRLCSPRYRTVTLSNQSYIWNVRKFACVHRCPVRFRTGFGFGQNKQKKSHLLTKFNNWHRRTRGKFILLNLKSIGKIVESFAFKIHQTVVCL